MEFGSKCKTFHSLKCVVKCRLRNGGHFVQGRWVNGAGKQVFETLLLWYISKLLHLVFTPQTVMLGETSPSLNHGAARNVASHGGHCDFTSLREIWSCVMLLKAKYQSGFFRGEKIISTQHQAIILRIKNSLIRPLQRLWFRYTPISRLFFNIYLH